MTSDAEVIGTGQEDRKDDRRDNDSLGRFETHTEAPSTPLAPQHVELVSTAAYTDHLNVGAIRYQTRDAESSKAGLSQPKLHAPEVESYNESLHHARRLATEVTETRSVGLSPSAFRRDWGRDHPHVSKELANCAIEAMKAAGIYEGEDAAIDARWVAMSNEQLLTSALAKQVAVEQKREAQLERRRQQEFYRAFRGALNILSLAQADQRRDKAEFWHSVYDPESPQFPTPWYTLPDAENARSPFTYSTRPQDERGMYVNSVGAVQHMRSFIKGLIAEIKSSSPDNIQARDDFAKLISESHNVERMADDPTAGEKYNTAILKFVSKTNALRRRWSKEWYSMDEDGVMRPCSSSSRKRQEEARGPNAWAWGYQEDVADSAAAERHATKGDVEGEMNMAEQVEQSLDIERGNTETRSIEHLSSGALMFHEKAVDGSGPDIASETVAWVRALFDDASAENCTLTPPATALCISTKFIRADILTQRERQAQRRGDGNE